MLTMSASPMDHALFHGTQWFSYKQHRLALAKRALNKLPPSVVAEGPSART
jgi:hypothetical protein